MKNNFNEKVIYKLKKVVYNVKKYNKGGNKKWE